MKLQFLPPRGHSVFELERCIGENGGRVLWEPNKTHNEACGRNAGFLGAFAKSRKATVTFVLSVRPPVRPSARPPIWDNSAHAGRIFVKFLISFLLQKICWENSGFVKIGEIRPFTLRTMFRSFDYFGYWRDHTCLCYRSFYCLCMCYGYANGPEVFINL